MSDSAAAPAMLDLTDSAMWNKILHKASADQEPAVFTSTLRARRAGVSGEQRPLQPTPRYPSSAVRMDSTGSSTRATTSAVDMIGTRDSSHSPACNEPASYERDLFLVMSKPVLETLMALWMSATEDHLICRLMQGLWDFITICMDFGLDQLLSRWVIVSILCIPLLNVLNVLLYVCVVSTVLYSCCAIKVEPFWRMSAKCLSGRIQGAMYSHTASTTSSCRRIQG